MSKEILVALISLIGVFISIAVSLFVSVRQTNVELQKLRSEIQRSYAGKLHEKRLEVYSDIYFALSDFTKKIENLTINKSNIASFNERLLNLDSKYAIYFSSQTGIIAYRFRRFMDDFVKLSEQDLYQILKDGNFLSELKWKIGEYELSLKSDIGIYVVDFDDVSRRISSYRELNDAVEKKKNSKKQR